MREHKIIIIGDVLNYNIWHTKKERQSIWFRNPSNIIKIEGKDLETTLIR